MKTPLNFYLRRLPLFSLALGLTLLCGACASNKPVQACPIATIPRNSDASYLKTDGFLIVNTPKELHFDERSVRRFPHTGYSIYDCQSHQLIRYVRNRVGQAGEVPATMVLPSGIYLVEARTVYHQPITFPVVIKPQTATTVNLEGDFKGPKNITGEFYTLESHGRPYGWLLEASAK